MSLKELREEIEREFKEKFCPFLIVYSSVYPDGRHNEYSHIDPLTEMKVKDFISSALDRQLSAFRQMVEESQRTTAYVSKPYEVPPEMFDEVARQTGLAYRQALSDLLAKLNEDGK